MDALNPKDRAADRALRKKYGISLAEYGRMLAEQDFGCAICQKPPGAKRLHVDHDHSFKYARLKTVKVGKLWTAHTATADVVKGLVPSVIAQGSSKSLAIRAVRDELKRRSIRGLCCWPCNRSLRSFNNNPEVMQKAAQYLLDFKARTKGEL
jgi:hypothetical protein